MKEKLATGESLKVDFAGKRYVFEKVNPFFLKVSTDGEERLISIEGTVEIRMDTEFYEHPYFYKWKIPIQASSKTTLKFILKLPLQKKLVVEAGKRDIVIDSFHAGTKKAWYGPVSAGELCDFVTPEVLFEPEAGEFANMIVRIVNPSNVSREITRFVVNPDRLMLYHAENGYFTNKIYVNIVREGEFSMDYGKGTTKAAKKAKKIIKEKAKSHKKVLTRFSPLNVARDFGFGD
jgi:hypothetical protein